MLLALSEPIKVGPEPAVRLTDHRRVEVGRILTERDALTRAARQRHDPRGTSPEEMIPGPAAALPGCRSVDRRHRPGVAPLQQARLATLARIEPPIGEVESRSPTSVW